MLSSETHAHPKMNEAITDLQIRITHQDDTLEQLNAIVTRQQLEMDLLKAELIRLRESVQDLKDSGPATQGGQEVPPHY